jgi:hypothetical protein
MQNWTRIIAVLLTSAAMSLATTYYVDSQNGNDGASGTSAGAAWKSLAKVNATTFGGDTVLFACGGVWNDTLCPRAAGTAQHPFVVSKYGTGNMPLINGGGPLHTVHFYNQEYFEISNLEITNIGTPNVTYRRGISLEYRGFGKTIHHAVIRDLFIHAIDGVTTGANFIYFQSGGVHIAVWDGSPFDDLRIEGNRIRKVHGQGILKYNTGGSGASSRAANFVIRNNNLDSIGGDGIVLYAVKNGLVEHNVLHHGGWGVGGNCCAGMFGEEGTYGVVWQYNEVYDEEAGGCDRQAYDSDFRDSNAVFQYNYSHNNAGGFMLFVPSSHGCIVRYNLSQSDLGTGWGLLFHFNTNWPSQGSVVDGTEQIYNNVFYEPTGRASEFCEKEYTPQNVFNNIFVNISMNNVSGANNCFYGGSGGSTTNGNITGDPKFVGPAGSAGAGLASAAIYKLQAGSPCIGKGKLIADNGSKDYFGGALPANGAIDIGIHQYGANPVAELPAVAMVKELAPMSIKRDAHGVSIILNNRATTARIFSPSGAIFATLGASRSSLIIPALAVRGTYLAEIRTGHSCQALPIMVY